MRKADLYGMAASEARELLARAPFVHLATTRDDGAPILRALHGVFVGDRLAFHAAPVGEKVEGLGRTAVVTAERVLAEIPSWFVDPERACPATTYYESAMARGRLVAVDHPGDKARVLSALMGRFQPEGRHAPIEADSPLYAKQLGALLVFALEIEELTGKAKVGQNRSPAERTRIAEGLWRRGAPGDCAAIEALLARNPDTPLPAFLRAPIEGARLVAHVGPERHPEAVDLLRGAYWLEGVDDAAIAAPFARSAGVGAVLDGRLVAAARATSDGARAWIYDVIVLPALRGRGLARALVAQLLDHPDVRDARTVRLSTWDAAGLYERGGFRVLAEVERGGRRVTEMILERS